MEAAIEQACCQGVSQTSAPPQSSSSSLSLQQSRQVLGVLEEAFSAQMYHLQQVRGSPLNFLLLYKNMCINKNCECGTKHYNFILKLKTDK